MTIQEVRSVSVPTDDHDLILFVPDAVENPLSVSALGGASVVPLTYYFTADGFAPSYDQAKGTDDRWTDPQSGETLGKTSGSLDITYVINLASPENDVARLTLATGVSGTIIERPGVPHGDALAVGQHVNRWRIDAGVQQLVQPETNAPWKCKQTVAVKEFGTFEKLVA